MKLEKISLNGFKSFADKVEFGFQSRITAIVGPNGCGKSNIVDALKWVLGNQSPKSLRSGQMSDVIFSGSSSRKASGRAEVSLHFSDVGSLGVEQEELEICRRLYRSGESEYLINGKSCRLRDIRELFMDTGIGVSAYSIIEQGQIDQLLHASKTDRRVIFEEAAGISKFKAHKKEATRKLDRTEQNLLRLADIVTEVGKQLRSIKLQAGKARNYLQYSEHLKELRVNYSLSEYDKIISQTRTKKALLGEFEEKFSVIVTDVARNDALVSELGRTIIETEGQINTWDNALISAKSKIEQQFDRIELLKTRIDELTERKANASRQISKLSEQDRELEKEFSGCETAIGRNEELFEEKNQMLGAMEEEAHEINKQCVSINADLEDEKSGIIDIVRRTAQLHNEIQSMSTYRSNLSGQKDRLSGRANAADSQLRELLTEKAQYQAKLGDVTAVLLELQESLDGKRLEIEAIDSRQLTASEQLVEAKERRSALSSEFELLSDMEAKRDGVSTSIKNILSAKSSGGADDPSYDYVEGIVADLISADMEYATAVEAALEGRTDALVINDTGRFLADSTIRETLDSRVKVICTDRIEPFRDTCDLSGESSILGRVVEFVKYDSGVAGLAWSLLGNTLVVESIEAAMELSSRLGSRFRYVTRNGEVFDGELSINIGPVGKTAGLISRKSRLTQLESELAKLSGQILELSQQLESDTQQNAHLSRLCKDLRTSVYEATTEKLDTESKVRQADENIRRLTDEQPVITSEINTLEQEISASVQKEHDSKQALDELEEINTQRNEHIEKLEGELLRYKELQETRMGTLTDLKVEIGQLAEQGKAMRQRITSLQSQLQHGRMAIESARSELSGCGEQMVQSERNILSCNSMVSELFVEKEKSERISCQMHRKVEEMLEKRDETEELLKTGRSEQSEVEQQMHEVEVELGQLQVKNEDLTQRVDEELGINLADAYENFEQESVDWEQVREEIATLRGKIERLGNVNLDAIDEQQDLEQRYEFLTSQAEDLNDSKLQLEQLITKINDESRDKFIVTFEEVRKNFQLLFRKLFGGGKADVILEDETDVLESGIEIMAKPPGKETRSISLLSGGEKTLTALALLFAVFRSKPSPFCFLDEVDAALDEANNERFNMIVQEFQKDSQFIIVTHSKRTMSIADVLYGVTMQTHGVSKKISVRFDRADSQTDAAVA